MTAHAETAVASDTKNDVGTQTETNPSGVRARLSELTADVQRGFVAEWAVTIILLLFGTTTLVRDSERIAVGTLLIGRAAWVLATPWYPLDSARMSPASRVGRAPSPNAAYFVV